MYTQLTLQVQLRDEATFANFFHGQNEQLATHLQSQVQEAQQAFFYLWGASGVGKSHLLQASCLAVKSKGRSAAYISLSESELTPDILEGLDDCSLVCLDDIDVVLGKAHWEEAIFHFYNAIREQNHCLVVAATSSPNYLNCCLPDLRSRFTWGMVYQVHGLSDAEKCAVLQLRAKQRGLSLSDEVANFLLRRCSRDMTTLYQILNDLDQASLRSKRSLSIPFIKEVLGV